MSFLKGVWRMLGAEDEMADGDSMLEYPAAMPTAPAVTSHREDGIIPMPDPPETTLYVVRPELDQQGTPAYSLKAYASFLLTRQALVLDINALAADDVDVATRVVDFLAGVTEAVDGSVFEVTKNIFIFAPRSVKLAGDPLKPVEVS